MPRLPEHSALGKTGIHSLVLVHPVYCCRHVSLFHFVIHVGDELLDVLGQLAVLTRATAPHPVELGCVNTTLDCPAPNYKVLGEAVHTGVHPHQQLQHHIYRTAEGGGGLHELRGKVYLAVEQEAQRTLPQSGPTTGSCH